MFSARRKAQPFLGYHRRVQGFAASSVAVEEVVSLQGGYTEGPHGPPSFPQVFILLGDPE